MKIPTEVETAYRFAEHACTAMYATNTFIAFTIGKKIADAGLILILVVIVSVHICRKCAESVFSYRHSL